MTKSNKLNVIATVVDTERATFYLAEGGLYTMSQSDPRLKLILDQVLPLNARNKVAIVNLDTVSSNTFAEAEKTTGGIVRFFKVARKALVNWLTPAEEPAQLVPVVEEGEDLPARVTQGPLGRVMEAREEKLAREAKEDEERAAKAAEVALIMQPKTEDLRPHMEPVKSDQTFDPVEESIVAVYGDQVIPDVHQLEGMLKNMNQTRKTAGFQAFMRRISEVIKERRHSVEDLLRFLEKGDLPLTNDGCVIAYKRLNSTSTHGVFVDVHSGKVRQKVGSIVRVKAELVDLRRDQECSNGLHIARRGYLGSFSGNVLVLCKIAPEDFMTVPHNDPNKVRVKQYEILDVISGNAQNQLMRNKPGSYDDKVFVSQLYRAINGLYPAPVEEVLITEQKGGGLKYTNLKPDIQKIEPLRSPDKIELEKVKAFDDPSAIHAATTPEVVHSQIDAIQQAADELGEDPEDVAAAVEFFDKVVDNGGTNEGMGKMMPEPTPPDPEVAHGGGALSQPQEAPVKPFDSMSFKEKLAHLWIVYQQAATPAVRVKTAEEMMAVKKSAKKGWDALGVSPTVVTQILNTIEEKETLLAAPAPEPTPTKASDATKSLSDKLGGKRVAVPDLPEEKMNKVEKTRFLFNKWNTDNSKANADALLAHKKSAKKGWSVLGLTDKEIETIDLFLGDKK